VSSGPWASAEEVQRWRESAAFREGVVALGAVLDDFRPGTFDLLLRIGQGAS
jgi:hypothetical protein